MPRHFFRRDVFIRLIVLGGIVYLAVRSFDFLIQTGNPAGYFYDLGVHLLATSYEVPTIRTFADLVDCIGWAAWADVPQFAYNPMTTNAILITFVKLGANVQLAVKLLMVAQFWIAFASMTFLYATWRRSWTWALVAGVLYAFFPATSLQISTNLDLGFTIALAPLAFALSRLTIRRFGMFAFPISGAMCGFAAEGFATEYVLVVSIPLFVAVSIGAYDPRKRRGWLLGTMLGGIAAIGVGLYCVLPTFASNAVISSPATRIADVESGGPFTLFAETISAMWHGVLTESTLSPGSEFNATGLLWVTSVALTVLWISALAFAARRLSRGGAGRRQAILLALLILLAFGSTVPFGATFWTLSGHVPFLQLLRTPDRLMVVPFLFVVLWGVALLEALGRRSATSQRRTWSRATAAALAVVLCSFAYFDFAAGALLVRPTTAYRLPDLDRTLAVSEKQPAPLLSYSFVNRGSVLDTPLYGFGTPTRAIGQDIVSRYGAGSAHGLGLLRKAGIATIVTTPLWSLDGTTWPDLQTAFATSRWTKRLYGKPDGPSVWHVRASNAAVSRASAACFHGGPGTLDEAALLPAMSDAAFVQIGIPCAFDVYANYDPRDESTSRAIATWPASRLGAIAALHDTDYSFVTTRTLLARPWYRDAIQGDAPAFGTGAASIDERWSARESLDVPARGRYVVDVRAATPAGACFSVSERSNRVERCEHAGYGLHWLSLPITLEAGSHQLIFRVRPEATKVIAVAAVLDGVKVRRDATPSVVRERAALLVYSTPWLANPALMRPLWLPAGTFAIAWYGADGAMISRHAAFGREVAGRVRMKRPGYLAVATIPAGADMIVFSNVPAGIRAGKRPIVRKTSATTWRVDVPDPEIVRATVLNDRSWSLDGEGRHFDGFDCDLVDTCFRPTRPGRYVLRHRYPPALTLGISLSAITWIFAALACGIKVLRDGTLKHTA